MRTSPGYNEYTNLSRLYESQSLPEIKTTQDWKKHYQKREKAFKGLLHNDEKLHNGFTQPKTL